MKGKKQHHEEHVDETWLLPYSDMLTLLLALFIVMFAMGQVDKDKLRQMSQQFNIIFSGGSGALKNNGSSLVPLGDASTLEKRNGIVEQDKMLQIKLKLEQEFKASGYADKVNVGIDNEGLEISIQDTVLFNSGDAEVLRGFYPILSKISATLKNLDNEIRVSGHTDNVPIHNNKFRSNWDLSYMRASNVMGYMVDTGHLSPKHFSVQAYGEYKPKFDNATEDGRVKNRRVEILIVRKYPLDSNKAN